MKLWADPLVGPPFLWAEAVEPVVWAKSVEEAQACLRNNVPTEMSICYDFGRFPCPRGHLCHDGKAYTCRFNCDCACHRSLPNGVELIDWMALVALWPKKVFVHDKNLLARRLLVRRLINVESPYPRSDLQKMLPAVLK